MARNGWKVLILVNDGQTTSWCHTLAGEAEFFPIMSWVDNQVVHMSDVELDPFHHGTGLELFVEWLYPQPYHVLSASLGGSALVVVKNLAEEKTRDINVWVEITKPFLLDRPWRRNCCYIFGTKVSRHVLQSLWQLSDVHAGIPVMFFFFFFQMSSIFFIDKRLGLFVTSLQVVFLHMQWDAPVNIPIVPKNMYEPKPNTKKATESQNGPWRRSFATRCINVPPIYKTKQLCQHSFGEDAEITRTRVSSPPLISPFSNNEAVFYHGLPLHSVRKTSDTHRCVSEHA